MEHDLSGARTRQARRDWCAQYVDNDCQRAMEQVRDRSRVQPFYDQIAQIYHENRVARVILLTCNVGNASTFLDEVSTDWGVPVAGYTRRVLSRSERAGGRTTVYMFLEGDEEGQGTNVPLAATEMMPGSSFRDAISGRVIRQSH